MRNTKRIIKINIKTHRYTDTHTNVHTKGNMGTEACRDRKR